LPWVAAASAPAALLPEHLPLGVPPLVIHPVGPCTVVGLSRVFVAVLMVTDTDGPEPAASATPEALRATTIAPIRAITVLRCIEGHPFPRGLLAGGRKLVSWLSGLPTAPSQLTRRQPVALSCGRRPRS